MFLGLTSDAWLIMIGFGVILICLNFEIHCAIEGGETKLWKLLIAFIGTVFITWCMVFGAFNYGAEAAASGVIHINIETTIQTNYTITR